MLSSRLAANCLHIISWEEAGVSIEDTLVPSIVILLDDVDGRPHGERQLILLVFRVVIQGLNWTGSEGTKTVTFTAYLGISRTPLFETKTNVL